MYGPHVRRRHPPARSPRASSAGPRAPCSAAATPRGARKIAAVRSSAATRAAFSVVVRPPVRLRRRAWRAVDPPPDSSTCRWPATAAGRGRRARAASRPQSWRASDAAKSNSTVRSPALPSAYRGAMSRARMGWLQREGPRGLRCQAAPALGGRSARRAARAAHVVVMGPSEYEQQQVARYCLNASTHGTRPDRRSIRHGLGVDLVRLQPLEEDSARAQPPAAAW